MKNVKFWWAAILPLLILSACGTAPQNVIESSSTAQENLDNVMVEFTIENKGKQSYKGTQKLDFKNKKTLKEYDNGNLIYIDPSSGILGLEGENSEMNEGEEEYYRNLSEQELNMGRDYIAYLEGIDPELQNKFKMESETDHSYVLTFNGTDEEKQSLLEKERADYYKNLFEADQSDNKKQENIRLKKYDISITIDKETNFMTKLIIHQIFSEKIQNETQNIDHRKEYIYSSHNKLEDIAKPESEEELPAEKPAEEPSEEPAEEPGESEDNAAYEEEAAKYVDALIQATVYQNTDNYISKAPDAESDDQKKKSAEEQKGFFIAAFETNLTNALKSFGAAPSPGKLEKATAAFKNALSQTKYEIVDSKSAEDGTSYTVTLSIEGFSETKLLSKDLTDAITSFQEGKMSGQEFGDKYLDILTKVYSGKISLEPAKEATVNVLRNPDGTYAVLMQDEYLLTFVQQ
ncbi:DUF6612 family protein [Metabacillus sp. 84]|uniref:DUF6612 family protein n=1 Tax=Metabacillus sp. 84 TaxID=3404705 RepID=UPI003CEEE0CF